MAVQCACKPNQINARVARANAFFTLVFGLIFIFTSFKWIVFVMLADFFLKVFFGPKTSPISQFNIWILRLLKIAPKPIFAPPKKFALKVGLGFSIIIIFFQLSSLPLVANIFAAVLSLFAALELFFEFCMGCWVYYLFNTAKNEVQQG